MDVHCSSSRSRRRCRDAHRGDRCSTRNTLSAGRAGVEFSPAMAEYERAFSNPRPCAPAARLRAGDSIDYEPRRGLRQAQMGVDARALGSAPRRAAARPAPPGANGHGRRGGGVPRPLIAEERRRDGAGVAGVFGSCGDCPRVARRRTDCAAPTVSVRQGQPNFASSRRQTRVSNTTERRASLLSCYAKSGG